MHDLSGRLQIMAETLGCLLIFIGNILYPLSYTLFSSFNYILRRTFQVTLFTDAFYSIEWCAVNDLTSSLLGVSSFLQLPQMYLWIALTYISFCFLQLYLKGRFPEVKFRVKGKSILNLVDSSRWPPYGVYQFKHPPALSECARFMNPIISLLEFLPIWCMENSISV